MPEGQSPLLLKMVPGFLYSNLLFIYKPHISQSQHLQKHAKRMVGWVTFPPCVLGLSWSVNSK